MCYVQVCGISSDRSSRVLLVTLSHNNTIQENKYRYAYYLLPTKYIRHALEILQDTIQNMGTHGSITGKTMMRNSFDHITTATTPLPNL